MKIDAHQHFWKYSPEEYGWIDDSMSRLRRDFLPGDLEPEIRAAGIDGAVSVQARQSVAETEFLLDLAGRNRLIRAVVGWAPLSDSEVGDVLARLARDKKLRGVRHVLQDEADERYMLREDFNRGVARLKEFGLVYDILVYERHLPQTLQFVDRHPDQVFVLDHLAKPRVRDGVLSPWQSLLVELAHRPNIYCKLSGLVTEADHRGWTEERLRPYFDTALSAFGPKRLMFGSDWPVCLLASEYGRWHQLVQDWIFELSDDERRRVLGGTAVEAYSIAL